MYSLRLLMMDGKAVRNMYIALQKKTNLKKLVHIVGFTIEIYQDARPYKRHKKDCLSSILNLLIL